MIKLHTMNKLIIHFSIFTLILGLVAFAHPIHLSVCEMNFNKESKSLEIAQKVFFDDLEDGVELIGGPKLNLFTEKEHPDSDLWLNRYFNQHLKVQINGKPKELIWVGRETDAKQDIQALWVYMEIPGIKKVKELTIENTILYDVHHDQRNMLHLTCNDTKKSWLFDFEKNTETIQW
ncbi:DUF6702 family protein [Flammeovirga agarivorans]|uniref:Uncharacterized protein n=1 Tax=Flammeovirga agarivorans TaxID=2726742 RepID=A0A7X8SH89_9BACT|nr:DUF6702 family protein [Flammeovirga agarivorans]NLR90083.1 hypothetical protein [Flammeovirga agarivorans]